MKQITPDEYVEGVYSIYDEMPDYKEGGDGSDNECDCIGMGRGSLKRKGVENVTGMNGTNYALRHTFLNVQKIKSDTQLRKGDIVLKTRDKDDKTMRLPDKYRKGGSDYSSTWGETNCTHYGSVTKEYPNLEITHMTSPKPKKDYSLGNWSLFGQLPWIDYSGSRDPDDEPLTEWVRVYAENGKPVKMRAKPSITCRTWWEVPCGAEVILEEPGDTWSKITWAGRSGYMKTKFLRAEDTNTTYTVTVSGVSWEIANEIVSKYGGTIAEE